VFRIAWRLQRIDIAGMTLFGALYGLLQTAAYTAAGSTIAQRVAFGHQYETLGRSMTYLLPMPVRLDTIGGWEQWRVYAVPPILFVFWAAISATGALRGNEDRGLVEQWRSVGVSIWRYAAYRFGVFSLVALVAATMTSIVTAITAAVVVGSALDPIATAEMTIVLFAVTLTGYSVGMVVAQLTTSRNAAPGLAGVVLVVAFFINSFGRSIGGLRTVASFVSPFYYYDRSTPLIPGGSFDPLATAGLLVAAIFVAALAAWLMDSRDLGASIFTRRSSVAAMTVRPSHNPLLRIPVLTELYQQRIGILVWAGGSAVAAAYIGAAGHTLVDDLTKGSTTFKGYLTVVGHGNPYVALTGYFWFSFFLAGLSAFAITQVARWSADDNEGRLETVLSAPVSRTRVVLVRAAVLVVDLAIIIALSSLAFYAGAHKNDVAVPANNLLTASLLLVPFAMSFAAVGALLASRVPRSAVSVLVTLSFLSFLITLGGPLMKWPSSVMRLSVYTLYGQPLTSGVDWTGLWILVAICVVGFGLAVLLMRWREVGA
jgi:ABC-2 type transport system permease protein